MDVLLLSAVAVFNLILGVLVLWKEPGNKINLAFSIVVFSLSFWVATWAITFSVSDPAAKLFWTKMMLAGPSITPTAFLYFSFIFPKTDYKFSSKQLFLFFVLPSLIMLSLVPTDLYIKSVKAVPWGIDFTPGPAYVLNSIFFASFLGAAFVRVALKYRRITGMDKERLRYLFLGTFLAAIIGLLVNFILPMIGLTRFNKIGPMGTTFIVAFTSYAIIKKNLMNITVVISRAVAEILAVLLQGAIYLLIVWYYRRYVSSSIDVVFVTITVLFGIMVGQTHQGLRLFFQTSADKLFLHGRYNYYKSLSDASSQVGQKLSLENIIHVLYETFHEVVEISNPRVFLPESFTEVEKNSNCYLVYDKQTYQPMAAGQKIAMESPLVKELIATRKPVLDVKELNAALVVPCLLEDRLIAFFALGHKLSEDGYTDEDLRLLEVLANQAAITLDHTRSYETIRTDLESMERQLERSQRLASIGTLTAGVTHEIRNPLTVIRAETERLANQERDKEYLKQYSDLVLKHVDRIAGIVQRMLGLAKEKTRREAEINLTDLLDSTLELFVISNVTVQKDLKPLPLIKGDPEEMQEVFVNLIQNALEAMTHGGKLGLSAYTEEHRSVIEISDTGKGIPEELRERIFDPFFSTRHEGVGLGLSIAYRIVREHGGDIKVTSEIGKGSTFRLLF